MDLIVGIGLTAAVLALIMIASRLSTIADHLQVLTKREPPSLDNIESSLHQLARATWAIQSFSAAPVAPPYEFDERLQAEQRSRRAQCVAALQQYFDFRFHNHAGIPDPVQEAGKQAILHSWDLLGANVGESAHLLDGQIAAFLDSGADPKAMASDSKEFHWWDSLQVRWLEIRRMIEQPDKPTP